MKSSRTPPGRLAIPVSPSWLRAMIAPGSKGAYLLVKDRQPIYVGRSDNCVLARLLGHEKLPHVSHVLWEPCESEVKAYHIESFWFDSLCESGSMLNKLHPAKPEGHKGDCPFCAIKQEHIRAILPDWSFPREDLSVPEQNLTGSVLVFPS